MLAVALHRGVLARRLGLRTLATSRVVWSRPPPVKLSEDIVTVPNLLTMSRMALCPAIGWAVMTHQSPLSLIHI